MDNAALFEAALRKAAEKKMSPDEADGFVEKHCTDRDAQHEMHRAMTRLVVGASTERHVASDRLISDLCARSGPEVTVPDEVEPHDLNVHDQPGGDGGR